MAYDTKTGSFNTGTGAVSSTVAVTGVGFQPKALIFWWNGQSTSTDGTTITSHGRPGIGFAASTTKRGCVSGYDEDAVGTMITSGLHNFAACIATCDGSPAIDGALDLQSMDSDGFTLVVDDVLPVDLRVHYLALGGADLTDVDLVEFTSPTSTGLQSITSLSFQPDCVLFATSANTASPSAQAALTFAIGAAMSSTAQAATGVVSENGTAASDTASVTNDSYECISVINRANSSQVTLRASMDAMLSNGFRLNWLEVLGTASYFMALALKGGQYKIGSALTQTDTTTDIVETGLGFSPKAVFVAGAGARTASTQDATWGHADISVGAFTSTTERVAMAYAQQDNLATSSIVLGVEHDACFINMSTSGLDGLVDVKSVDSDGFTLIMDDADPVQGMIWYVAFGDATGMASLPTVSAAATAQSLTVVGGGLQVALPVASSTVSLPSLSITREIPLPTVSLIASAENLTLEGLLANLPVASAAISAGGSLGAIQELPIAEASADALNLTPAQAGSISVPVASTAASAQTLIPVIDSIAAIPLVTAATSAQTLTPQLSGLAVLLPTVSVVVNDAGGQGINSPNRRGPVRRHGRGNSNRW